MPRLRSLVVLLVTAASCAHQPKVERQPSAHSWSGAAATAQTRVTVDDKSAELFKPYELEGTFVLADVAGRQLIVVGSALAAEQMIPAATFEVPAALIGLSTGAIDERTSLVYTGKYYPRETWMHDQTLASALLNSVDWYFEELLRRIGPERLQHGLDVLAYGNRLLSDGPESFWTTSGLRVSALEQVAFWRRMESGELPSPITPACRWRSSSGCCRPKTSRPDGHCTPRPGSIISTTPAWGGWWVTSSGAPNPRATPIRRRPCHRKPNVGCLPRCWSARAPTPNG